MTVCIAATCRDGEEYAIVLCADAKGSTPLGSKELMMKVRLLPHYWRCLTAGNDDDIIPLLHLFKAAMWKLSSVDETNIIPTIQAAIQARKQQKADEYTQRKWGLSFADFRKARSEFPEEEYRLDISAIGQIPIEADCIIAGFVDGGFPLIVQAHGHGGVHIKEDFAVAGEGSYLAQYGLLHRDHYDIYPLHSTVYCAYEAKKYAERVASVGKETYLGVMKANSFELITPSGVAELEKSFQKYGPQAFARHEVVLPDGSFVSMRGHQEVDR